MSSSGPWRATWWELPSLLLLALAPVALGLTALAFAWTSTGSDPTVVVWWLTIVVVGLLVPGWTLTRVLRADVLRWTDAGWALPAGCVLALLTWLAGHVVGAALSTPLVGAAVVLLALVVPWSRNRILGTTPQAELVTAHATQIVGPPVTDRARRLARLRVSSAVPRLEWGLVLGGLGLTASVLVLVRWMWSAGLSRVPPVPIDAWPVYHQDLLYQTALTGEARRSLEPQYPMVDGEPLGYHWFFHALAAQLGGSGLHDLDVVTRLLPSSLMLGLVLLAASLGQQMTGRLAGGVVSAAVLAVFRPVTLDAWQPRPLESLQGYWQASPTATLGWVFGLATLGCLVAFLRHAPDDRAAPTALGVLFAAGAAGAKSAQVPVLLAGTALSGVVWLLAARRQPGWGRGLRRHATALLVLGVIIALAVALIYRGSYGLRFDPSVWIKAAETGVLGRLGRDGGEATGSAVAVAVRLWGPTLLVGLGAVALLRRQPRDPSAWVPFGALAAGMGAVLLLDHPSLSQYYFFFAAVPLLLVAAGAGAGAVLGRLVDRLGYRRALSVVSVPAVVVVAATSVLRGAITAVSSPLDLLGRSVAGSRRPVLPPVSGTRLVAMWTWPGLTIVFLLLAVTAGAALLAPVQIGRLPRAAPTSSRLPAGMWSALACLLTVAAGLVHLAPVVRDTSVTPASVAGAAADDAAHDRPATTRALFDAGQYLRQRATPDDVVATNRVWSAAIRSRAPDNRDFTVSAFSGLRTDVSGYGYAPRMLQPTSSTLPYSRRPFWDPARLEAELALVRAPTAAALDRAWRERGTRWVLADERSGPVSPELAVLADEVFDRDGVHLYHLRPPTTLISQGSDRSSSRG